MKNGAIEKSRHFLYRIKTKLYVCNQTATVYCPCIKLFPIFFKNHLTLYSATSFIIYDRRKAGQ